MKRYSADKKSKKYSHFVFGIVSLIDFIIPDVPSDVRELIDKESFEVQTAIWETKTNNECLRSTIYLKKCSLRLGC
ncbi:hypothetical protein BpHYR1_018285 [Brachionus plicatilis]|uniref:Uncharacterized protein n=1 Tax=Brachionus plicatilis TaxID=10195 RepID=A0A3M7P9X3_BRAPC|nr:hypothetical protein BpHYR1_018285 [Brachionus plicatilis]